MQLNLKISEKGLVLIAVPIVFELLFITILLILLHQSDLIAAKESNKRLVATELHRVYWMLSQELALMIAYDSTPDKSILLKCEALDLETERALTLMIDAVATMPSAKTSAKRVASLAEELVKGVRVCREYVIAKRPDSPYISSAFELQRQLSTLVSEGDKLLTELGMDKSSSTEAYERSRNLVDYSILAALACNILLATYLTIYFARNISSRASAVITNTKNVSIGQPLSGPLQGKDEFAEIDTFVHKMADEIREKDSQKHQILSMVSHDIRTPIASAKLLLALALRGTYGPIPELADQKLRRIDESMSFLLEMTDDLLETEKLRSGTFELQKSTVNYVELCKKSVNSVNANAENKGVELRLFTNSDCTGEADGDRIIQVLNNLLSNAIKFSPEKSVVSLTLSAQGDNEIRIEITDSGPGIPIEAQDQIFERLHQTELGRRFSGSFGLGLSICKQIVQMHKGEIGVSSTTQSSGTTFWLKLPRK